MKEEGHEWWHFGLRFAVAMLVAEVLYRTIEKPFLRVGAAVAQAESETAVPKRMRLAFVALGAVMVLFPVRHALAKLVLPKNIALNARVTMSSRDEGACLDPSTLVNGMLESDRPACGGIDEAPWAEIDLGQPHDLRFMLVYNREDQSLDDQIPLEASVSTDHTHYTTVARNEHLFTQGVPWHVNFPEGTKAQFVRFTVTRKSRLGLTEVEIFERP
jgi:hypothetical protein